MEADWPDHEPRLPAWLLPYDAGSREEGSEPDDEAGRFRAILASFRARHPHRWDELRLCPLQHGIETITAQLALERR